MSLIDLFDSSLSIGQGLFKRHFTKVEFFTGEFVEQKWMAPSKYNLI